MIKKILFMIMSSVLTAAVMASCSSSEKTSSESEISYDSSEAVMSGSDASVPETESDMIISDDIASYQYYSAMKNRNFVLSYYIPEHEIKQTICISGNKVYSSFSDPGITYQTIYDYDSNKQYMLIDDKYCTTQVTETGQNIIAIYSDLKYRSSGEQKYDEKSCIYDEFDQIQLGTSIKLLTSQEGELIAFDQSGTLARIDDFSDKSDDSLFVISKEHEKVSEDEIRKIIEQNITSHFR